jgi:5-methylcytosine-specific restriction endonuclease McrA
MDYIQPYSTVLVLNSTYEPIHFTNWKRAIVLIFKEKAKKISNRVIRLVNYVKIPFTNQKDCIPTRKMIYKRDDYECQYCGTKKDLTIDHVIPRSKGGKDTWNNLVCACTTCNVKKGNKLLKDTNMKLKNKPKVPFNTVFLEIEKTKVEEWKPFYFENS